MINRFPKLFKEYKKERYEKYGETQADIAKRWGIDASTMSRYANGHINGMTFEMIETICNDMDITPNDLMWKVKENS